MWCEKSLRECDDVDPGWQGATKDLWFCNRLYSLKYILETTRVCIGNRLCWANYRTIAVKQYFVNLQGIETGCQVCYTKINFAIIKIILFK